jgi:hypothetical protein
MPPPWGVREVRPETATVCMASVTALAMTCWVPATTTVSQATWLVNSGSTAPPQFPCLS